MTDQELKDIVAAVVAELEKSGVDFDYKAEPAEDGDLVFVIRGTAPNYQGVTVTWKGLLDIITAQATQAKNDAETAKNAANTILEQVQSKGTEITNFVATSKAELETQKNESVNAVKSVYQTDLNELKGDLDDFGYDEIIFSKENKYIPMSGSTIPSLTPQNGGDFKIAIEPCSEGDVFTISGTGGENALLWAFVDDSLNVLSRSPSRASSYNEILVAPLNATHLIMHDKTGAKSFVGRHLNMPDVVNIFNKQLGVTFAKKTPNELETLLTASDVNIGDKISYDFVATAGTGYIDILNQTGERIEYIGKGFSIDKKTHYTGVYSIPSNFGCMKAKGSIEIYNLNVATDLDELSTEFGLRSDIQKLNFSWIQGNINITTGESMDLNNRVRLNGYLSITEKQTLKIVTHGQKLNIFNYTESNEFMYGRENWITSDLTIDVNPGDVFRFTIANADDSTITPADVEVEFFVCSRESNTLLSDLDRAYDSCSNFNIRTHAIGNCSIVCAKEHTFSDGSYPKTAFYLLEEPILGKFYISRNLITKTYAFTFFGSYRYSFGILANGDIIAVRDADTLESGKQDSHRKNPYVWKASENWSTCHEVDFGSALKPCGWLMNQGFTLLPNGDAVFAEYTRMTVATANVWKIVGDPLVASNWVVTKQFEVTTTDNQHRFKHCHMAQVDPYTGIIYVTTGDIGEGAIVIASSDNGVTWNTLASGSEKYCRVLNYVFTENYIYWATDTSTSSLHYVFRAQRNSSGFLDFNSIEDWVSLGGDNGATYALVKISQINCLAVLNRFDGTSSTLKMQVVNIDSGELIDVTTLESVGNAPTNLGFRARYIERTPYGSNIYVGFGFKNQPTATTVNYIKAFGNNGASGDGSKNINNLILRYFKNENKYGLIIDTIDL